MNIIASIFKTQAKPTKAWIGSTDEGKAIAKFLAYKRNSDYELMIKLAGQNNAEYSAESLGRFSSIADCYHHVSSFFAQMVMVAWRSKVASLEDGASQKIKEPRIVHIVEVLPNDKGLPIAQVWIDDLDVARVLYRDPETRQELCPPQCVTLATARPDGTESTGNEGNDVLQLWKEVYDYRQAITDKPNDAESYCSLGLAYVSLELWQEAIDAFKQAVSIEPDYADAHSALGTTYLTCGNKDAAIDEHKILKALDRDLANALFNLIHGK